MNNSQEKSRLSLIITSAKMAVATLISRILGLFREQLIASYFGASGLTDAFYVAYRIPNLLRDLFAEGAFSSAFIPIFTEEKNKSAEDVRKLFSRVFWSLVIITGILSFIIYSNAHLLIKTFAPEFLNQPEKFELTVLMVKILAPFLLFICVAALFMGVLNTYKIFFWPALMPAVGNVAVILSIIFLVPYMKSYQLPAIISVPIGVILGGFLQFTLMIPALLKLNLNFRPSKNLLTKPVKRVYAKMGPGLLGFSINQINLLINTILATGAGIGAISWLNFGSRLFQFPNGIVSVSLGNSNLVHFAHKWKENKTQEALAVYLSTYKIMIFLIIPITFFTLIFSEWISCLVFERGNFTRVDTFNTAKALFYYSLSLPLYGLYKVTVPVFYTIDKERVPVISSFISIFVNIIFALTLIKSYGFVVLAMASSISIFVNCLILLTSLKPILKFRFLDIFSPFLFKTIGSSLLACSLLFLGKSHFLFFEMILLKKIFILSSLSIVFFSMYFLFMFLMGEREKVLYILKKFKIM